MAAKAEQPMAAPRRGEFRAQSEHVEKLAAKLDQAGDPEVRAAALELVQSVVELHGAALQRLIDKCLETASGEQVLMAALDDNLVAGMFLLLTLYQQEVLGWSALRTGLAYLPFCLAFAPGFGISAFVMNKAGTKTALVSAFVVSAAGMALMASELLCRNSSVTVSSCS